MYTKTAADILLISHILYFLWCNCLKSAFVPAGILVCSWRSILYLWLETKELGIAKESELQQFSSRLIHWSGVLQHLWQHLKGAVSPHIIKSHGWCWWYYFHSPAHVLIVWVPPILPFFLKSTYNHGYSQPTSPYTVSSSTSSSLWNTGNGIMAPGVRLLIGQSRVSLEPRRVHIHSYVGQSTFALTCVIIFACMANLVYCKHEKMPSQISSKRPNLHRMHHHLCISDNCSVSKISLVWNRRLLRILPRAQICAPSILCSFVTT